MNIIEETSYRRRRGFTAIAKEPHWLFLFFSFIFGLFYVIATPPLWGIDETAHVARVYQITHNQMNFAEPTDSYKSTLPDNLQRLILYTHKDLANNVSTFPARKDVDNIEHYRHLLSENFSQEQVQASAVASYSPFAYVGPIIGALVSSALNLSVGASLTLQRIFSLFTYIAIIFSAIYIVRAYKIKWAFLLVALLPTLLFSGSTTTADTMLISLSILLLALHIRFIVCEKKEHCKKLFIAILLIGILIAFVKVNYSLLSVGVLLSLPLKRVYLRYSMPIKLMSTAVLLAVSILWYFLSVGIGNPSQSQLPQEVTSSGDQMDFVVNHPTGFITAVLRSIHALGDSYIVTGTTIVGWNYVSIPTFMSVIALVAIFTVLLIAANELKHVKRYFILPVIFSMIGVLSVFLALYLAHTPTAYPYVRGVQGRYMIPFLLPIALLIAMYSKIYIDRKSEVRAVVVSVGVIIFVSIWSSCTYFFSTY